MSLNPNSARNFVDSYIEKSDANKIQMFPNFFMGVTLNVFRHINNLSMMFKHPISVISGSNKSGKTSVLMTIACSHYNFERPDVANGAWKRATWSHLVRFTNHDAQIVDWEYHVKYREGNNQRIVRGYRNHISKKWGGAGKKEGQIGRPRNGHMHGGRHVCLIDLNRINPGRHLTTYAYAKARVAAAAAMQNKDEIREYLSYILETSYDVNQITEVADNKLYQFQVVGEANYSSFNTASGEDVLVNMLSQILYMPDNSLILIDEIEIGLHPKIQRRLMDVIYIISQKQNKQFIITSHSYAIIDSVPKESRLFIENIGGHFSCKSELSTYETLTRMDSEAFPVVSFYVEDDESKRIIEKAIDEINQTEIGFARLLRVIVVGSAPKTYGYFKTRQSLHNIEKLATKPACVLDGDMENKRDKNGNLEYPAEDALFFHYSSEAPEKMLVKFYIANNPNVNLQYHVDNSNVHCLFDKMVELGVAVDKREAFEKCFECYRHSNDGGAHFESLKGFLKDSCR